MQQPIIPLLMFFIAGIISGYLVAIPAFIVLSLSLFSFTCLIFSFIRGGRWFSISCIFLSLFFFGILNSHLYLYPASSSIDISRFIDKEKITIEGVVCKAPDVSPHKVDLIVAAQRIIDGALFIPTDETILLSLRLKGHPFQYGDYIRATVRLRKPHNFNNPGGFDYKEYLLFRGIQYRGFVNNPTDIVTIRENRGNIFKASLERYRSKLRNLIVEHSPAPESSILQALILGEKREIPFDILDHFNRTGVSHMLAISGLHIGIIAFLAIFIVRLIMKTSEYLLLRFNMVKVSLICAVMPIIGYASIAGFRISTIRATIMIISLLIAILIGRERDLLNTLACAALAILAFSPMSLFDVSFQLSFIAVAAIVIITPALHSLLPTWEISEISYAKKIFKRFAVFIFVTFSAALGTAPLIAYYFNRISTMTLFSNIIIIPIIGFIVLPLGILSAFILPFSTPAAALFIKIASLFVGLSNSIIGYLAHFPFSSFSVTTPSIPEIVLYYSFIFIAVKLIHSPKARYSIALAVISLCIIGLFLSIHIKATNPGKLRVTCIDVGQGSSTLVRFPGGRTMLVDGGGFYSGSFDVGRYVVAPYLWHERIKTIDLMVLTHPHQDHLAGLVFVLKNFAVKEVWSNGTTVESDSYKEFTRVIAERHIPHRIVSRDTFERIIGDAIVGIIHPPKGSTQFDTNNNSVVMKITYKKIAILLPADIEEAAQQFLLSEGTGLKSDILLAPHHGAYTPATPSFLGAVRPRFVVSSCGKDNVFGFPDEELVDICRRLGITLLRTDTGGAISFVTDGTEIHYSCHIP